MSLIKELTVATGLSISDIERIIATAPIRYKSYRIPKKHGGFRTIAQPSREVKILQYVLLGRHLNRYPVHSAAMAYVKGRNIFDNAASHTAGRVFLKLDFREFFPSITAADWKRFLSDQKEEVLEPKDVLISTQILFWGQGTSVARCLSIGAPTSPTLSNVLLFELDARLAARAAQCGIGYTRYADDITMSGRLPKDVLAFEEFAKREVSRLRYPKLEFNDEKRGLYGMDQRRMVTGLVITPIGEVSIGRERKREISALLHRFSLGQLGSEQQGHLKGLLGFTIANEPSFIERMRRKYGDPTVDAVLQIQVLPRIRQK